MLTQPKLVKTEDSHTKNINLKTQTKGSAQFLLGLNNRVSHMDKRISRLESASDHILRHHIGYKELTNINIQQIIKPAGLIAAMKGMWRDRRFDNGYGYWCL